MTATLLAHHEMLLGIQGGIVAAGATYASCCLRRIHQILRRRRPVPPTDPTRADHDIAHRG